MTTGIRPGHELSQGRYVIQELIGKGGMAAVHRARDTALDRTVAVKSMSTELAGQQSARERFRREARAVARIGHPRVVAVHDVGEEALQAGQAPVPYIVMEYVEGNPLSRLVPEQPGGMPLDEVLRITSDVLSALTASHAQGMVHRDVKPANIMVGQDGSVKVMDFGIARAFDGSGTALTGTGVTIGTPHYMAPEQFEGRSTVDGRTDLYAVGVVLVQLLTGRLPFDADSGYQIGYQHATMEPPTLAELGADVPAEVQGLVTRALAKAPDSRYADAVAMRASVDRLRPRILTQDTPPYGVPTAPAYSPTVLDGPDEGTGPPGPAPSGTDLHGALTQSAPARASEPQPRPAPAAPEPSSHQPPPRLNSQLPPTLSEEEADPYTLPPVAPSAPVRTLKERARLVRNSYGMLMASVALIGLTHWLPGGFIVLPLLSSVRGFWLAGKGGVTPGLALGGTGSGMLQAAAAAAMLGHGFFGLLTLVELATLTSG
ncbi:protein kinase domain-containing protein [Actinomycetota bacterium Odt1-20B]